MEENVFDWDAFEMDLETEERLRVGFFSGAHRLIALYQGLHDNLFHFCYVKESFKSSIYDDLLPAIIVFGSNPQVAEIIIPIRAISIYNNKEELNKNGVEIVFNRIGSFSISIYYEGRPQKLSNNEMNLLILYCLYQDYVEEKRKGSREKPYLTTLDCRKKIRELEKQVNNLCTDEVMTHLLVSNELNELTPSLSIKQRDDIHNRIHALPSKELATQSIDFYIQQFLNLSTNGYYQGSPHIEEFKSRLENLCKNTIVDTAQLEKEKLALLEHYSKKLYSETLFLEYVSRISGPVHHSVHNIEKKLII